MDDIEEFSFEPHEPVFTTTVVARLVQIPVWVLKRLDRAGVVSPDREIGKARLYSHLEVRKIKRVWYLMETRKVTINGVKVILEMEEKYESSD